MSFTLSRDHVRYLTSAEDCEQALSFTGLIADAETVRLQYVAETGLRVNGDWSPQETAANFRKAWTRHRNSPVFLAAQKLRPHDVLHIRTNGAYRDTIGTVCTVEQIQHCDSTLSRQDAQDLDLPWEACALGQRCPSGDTDWDSTWDICDACDDTHLNWGEMTIAHLNKLLDDKTAELIDPKRCFTDYAQLWENYTRQLPANTTPQHLNDLKDLLEDLCRDIPQPNHQPYRLAMPIDLNPTTLELIPTPRPWTPSTNTPRSTR